MNEVISHLYIGRVFLIVNERNENSFSLTSGLYDVFFFFQENVLKFAHAHIRFFAG